MLYQIDSLPDAPLEAAKAFHAEHLAVIEAKIPLAEDGFVIAFPPADYTHRGWCLAAVQELARAFAPIRVNAIQGDEKAFEAARGYLAKAPGVTGQLLVLDGTGAGPVLASEA